MHSGNTGDRMQSLTSKYIGNKIIILCYIFVFSSFLLLFAKTGYSYQINSISVAIVNNNEISVTTSLSPEAKFVEDLNEGMTKELVFYIDMFRVWKIWPDEFVKGRKISRILKSDPIRREYIAISIDGNVSIEKRFKDIDSMLSWSLNITDIKLTGVNNLEAGKYFVKATVESNIKKLPPVIGYFLFFISEREFSVSRNSHKFQFPQEPDK